MNAAVSPSACDLQIAIVTVAELLSIPNLQIPQYQRPYKWTSKHLNQLFQDVAHHHKKTRYRLGTIVLHQEDSCYQIVDGQQRTITLLLIVKALIAIHKGSSRVREFKTPKLKHQLESLDKKLPSFSFASDTAKINLYNNYQEILRTVSRADFSEELALFLLEKCEVVKVCLQDISEAFQFFDSQNARGKDLEPHDLLKAYHLREFSPREEALKRETVMKWESIPTKELAALFSQYLYRVRNWSRGRSALYFGKEDIPLFKGVNLEHVGNFPYVEPLRIAHHFVDNYNRNYERQIDGLNKAFPFRLDQTILNGRRFFEMVVHYQRLLKELHNLGDLTGLSPRILEALDAYEGRSRSGDRYVRNLFDCLLLYYVDKFGLEDISRAIEKIFVWAFSLRLKMERVYLEGVDKHVQANNLFQLLKDAIRPHELIHVDLETLNQVKSTKTDALQKLFQEMNYYVPRS